jgi:hypothetical protein
MRRLGWIGAFGVLLAAGAANATIIASGGGPGLGVRGQVQAHAEDPLAFDIDESFDESVSDPNGNGSIGNAQSDFLGQSLAQFDGEATVVGASASSSYSYSLFHNGGQLESGTIALSSYSWASINDQYFAGANDFARAESVATAINFMDLAITGTNYDLIVDGNVQDDNAQNGGGGSAFFFVADVTSGFDIVFFYGDAVPNDFDQTAFSDGATLLAGRTYRMGMGASTDFLCADTTGGTLCPAADPDNGIPAPVGPGFYDQSASMDVTFSLTAVPEPGTALLVGAGALLLAARRR